MLIYANLGFRNFGKDPVEPKSRDVWEFWVLLSGSIALKLTDPPRIEQISQPTLFAFPASLTFGWSGCGTAERTVFDFTSIPPELAELLPECGYFQVSLSKSDCNRMRALAEEADLRMDRPTQIVQIEEHALLCELCLTVLRESKIRPLAANDRARKIVDQALLQYASDLPDTPTLQEIGRIVHISPAQLRRIFHKVLGEGPKAAFKRIRMRKVEELLLHSDFTVENIAAMVGFASASALAHAVRAYFGRSTTQLRNPKKS